MFNSENIKCAEDLLSFIKYKERIISEFDQGLKNFKNEKFHTFEECQEAIRDRDAAISYLDNLIFLGEVDTAN